MKWRRSSSRKISFHATKRRPPRRRLTACPTARTTRVRAGLHQSRRRRRVASLGHIAVGMAAARLHRPQHPPSGRSMLAWSALAMLPDADVIGFSIGVRYADPWGHRGAAHSLTIAVIGAGVIAAI